MISQVEYIFEAIKCFYIYLRFLLGDLLGERIENFYKKYPSILLYFISSSNIGKINNLLKNTCYVDINIKYKSFIHGSITPLELAIEKQDTKMICILTFHTNKMINFITNQLKNSYLLYLQSENQAIELCKIVILKEMINKYSSSKNYMLQALDSYKLSANVFYNKNNINNSVQTTKVSTNNHSLSNLSKKDFNNQSIQQVKLSSIFQAFKTRDRN